MHESANSSIVAKIKDAGKPSKEFRRRRRRPDPTLARIERLDGFTMSVANIRPDDHIRWELKITELRVPTAASTSSVPDHVRAALTRRRDHARRQTVEPVPAPISAITHANAVVATAAAFTPRQSSGRRNADPGHRPPSHQNREQARVRITPTAMVDLDPLEQTRAIATS